MYGDITPARCRPVATSSTFGLILYSNFVIIDSKNKKHCSYTLKLFPGLASNYRKIDALDVEPSFFSVSAFGEPTLAGGDVP